MYSDIGLMAGTLLVWILCAHGSTSLLIGAFEDKDPWLWAYGALAAAFTTLLVYLWMDAAVDMLGGRSIA